MTAEFSGLLWTKKRDFEFEMDADRRLWMGYAGGEIRTLNPSRGLVFETSAYTVPPHRLVYSMIQHQLKEVNMRYRLRLRGYAEFTDVSVFLVASF